MSPCDCADCTRLRATQGKVPEHLREGLLRYFVHHQGVGGFLTAVLTNDLKRAVLNADRDSLAALRDIVAWIYNDAEPGAAWGSTDAVCAWLKKKETAS